jgi:hypothetical protein
MAQTARKKSLSPAETSGTPSHQLRRLILDLCEVLKTFGLDIKPDTEASWIHFASLSETKQHTILEGFKSYSSFLHRYIDEGRDPTDSKELVFKSIKHLGLHLPEGADDLVRDDYIVEIYSLEGYQLFRNFKFLDCVSYSLSELLVYEWPELFRRPGIVTDTIIGHFIKFSQHEILNPIPSGCPLHVIEEIFSEDKNKALIDQKEFVPLFEDDPTQVAAVMVLIKAELMTEDDGKKIVALDNRRLISDSN